MNGDYSIHLLLHFLFKCTQMILKNRCFWKCLQLSGAQKIMTWFIVHFPLFRKYVKSHIEVVDQLCNLSEKNKTDNIKQQRNCLKWKQHTRQTQRMIEHMEHILSSSSGGLKEGQYRWSHDQVLKTIAEAVGTGLESAKWCRTSKKTIAFVRVGAQLSATKRTSSAGLLNLARKWQVLVDLERQLMFPRHAAVTTLQPDIVLASDSSKQVVLLELTASRYCGSKEEIHGVRTAAIWTQAMVWSTSARSPGGGCMTLKTQNTRWFQDDYWWSVQRHQ